MSEKQPDQAPFQPITAQKRKRNWAMLAILISLVVVLYVITVIKIGAGHA
jgi:uncharacterized Tic20 family protein